MFWRVRADQTSANECQGGVAADEAFIGCAATDLSTADAIASVRPRPPHEPLGQARDKVRHQHRLHADHGHLKSHVIVAMAECGDECGVDDERIREQAVHQVVTDRAGILAACPGARGKHETCFAIDRVLTAPAVTLRLQPRVVRNHAAH